jgi:type I restriction enzyme S subunit
VVDELSIPLPPLPVQERIVQILQKADEIRRKRREALDLANKILPALFLEMFGDPATNPKGWPREPIGALVHFDTAQITPEPGQTYLYLAPEHIESQTGHYTGPHPTNGRDLGSAKHPFTSEHVLYCKLRPYLNKVVLPHTDGICSTELVPLRPGPKLLREFLGIYLRLPFFVAIAVQKSQGTKMPRFGPELMKRETMIVPPIPLQQAFCLQASQLMEASQRLKEALSLSSSSFDGLLSRAFIGKLTAEWEAANADEIANQQAFHERLPRLLVLALMAEKAKRAGRAAAEVLVTALMKYVFLLQMEGNGGRRRLYHFVPYHYGPFAKELYADLKKLQEEGLVTVDMDSEEEKTRIALVDPERAEQALAELPDDLKEDVAAIIENYGNLDHNSLLKRVYEKYPAYARKSRLKRTTRSS